MTQHVTPFEGLPFVPMQIGSHGLTTEQEQALTLLQEQWRLDMVEARLKASRARFPANVA